VTPDIAVKDVDCGDYDMVTVIGGPGALELAEHDEVLSLLKEMNSMGKKVTAICISPMTLAKAGVLRGKKATVFETQESVQALEQGGAEYTKENVTIDGNIITANGPPAAEEFGRKLVEALG
jgi:protease I